MPGKNFWLTIQVALILAGAAYLFSDDPLAGLICISASLVAMCMRHYVRYASKKSNK
jgi:uncharacterized membrane protein YjjP (DUF1212 family)